MRKGLKLIAIVEGTKGVISLIAGLGLHRLASENTQSIIEKLAVHLHLDPASRYSGVIFRELNSITYSKLTLIAIGAFVYSVIRLIEAYGLWNELAWVEWFALLGCAIYLPLEVYELVVNTGVLSFIAIIVNIIILGYLIAVVRGSKENA